MSEKPFVLGFMDMVKVTEVIKAVEDADCFER